MTHQPCNCIADINGMLEEHTLDTSIVISRDLKAMTSRTYTGLQRKDNGRAETRSRKPRIFAHKFCPFCGTRYEPEPPTWESIATAPRDRRIRVSHELDPSSRKIDTLVPTFGEWDESKSEWVCNAGFICNDGMLRFEPTHWLLDPAAAAEGGAA